MLDAHYPSACLPGEQQARPLLWWTDSQLWMLGSRVNGIWSAWIRDWVPGAAPSEAAAVVAHEQPALEKANWVTLGRRGAAAAWVHIQTDIAAEVSQTLFAARGAARPAGDGALAQAVALLAWEALADGLRTSLHLDRHPEQACPTALSFQPWSGCALVSLAGPFRPLGALLLNGACVRAALDIPEVALSRRAAETGSREALTPWVVALAGRKLPVRAELSACELDLGTLQSLRIGDIVPIPHALDAPLFVSASADIRVCSGFLGRHGEAKAIELARD